MIGCGKIAELLHLPDYAVCPGAEITALCDSNRDTAESMARLFAPNAAIYTDYRKMLATEKLDGVTVALPNYLHAPVSIHALRAGCHVLVEKPMAATSAETTAMCKEAKKAKRLLMVNQAQRRSALHRKAREVVESGVMGRILHVTAMFGHEGPEHWSPQGKWFFKKKLARFGAMADLGVHKADLIRYLTGKEVAEISAYTACLEKKNSDVEDNFVSALRFTDGTVGTLCASWTVKGASASYTILHCENGTLQVGVQPDKPLVAYLTKPACEIVFDLPPPLSEYPGSWGLGVSEGFVRAARGLESPFCTGEEGRRSLEIIFAAERSFLSGKSVKVKH